MQIWPSASPIKNPTNQARACRLVPRSGEETPYRLTPMALRQHTYWAGGFTQYYDAFKPTVQAGRLPAIGPSPIMWDMWHVRHCSRQRPAFQASHILDPSKTRGPTEIGSRWARPTAEVISVSTFLRQLGRINTLITFHHRIPAKYFLTIPASVLSPSIKHPHIQAYTMQDSKTRFCKEEHQPAVSTPVLRTRTTIWPVTA